MKKKDKKESQKLIEEISIYGVDLNPYTGYKDDLQIPATADSGQL